MFMDPQTIPLGCKFKFEPEDDELLVYLECKCMGEPMPCEGFIMEADLYRLPDPGLLFERTPEKVVYVFTKLKKVSKNGKRIDRTVTGNRTWKGVDGGKPIYNAEGRRVGEKKNFVLVNKKKMKLGYNMIEFSLDNVTLRNSRFDDYVVCKIKKKVKNLRGLKYGEIPEEETCASYVSTPATEGDATAISEEGYQRDEGKSIVLIQPPKEEEQNCYHVSESHQGMPMLCGDFAADAKLFSSEYFDPNKYQEFNSSMIDYEPAALLDLDLIRELASAPSLPPLVDEFSAAAPALPPLPF